MIKTRLYWVLILIVVGPLSLRGADFDGDGTDDPAVFRPASGLWAVRDLTRFYFGSAGDYPLPLNFNNSSASVPAIFRPASGLWAVRGETRVYFGGREDSPLRGDFNGDGRDEIGICRLASGLWAIRSLTRVYFGAVGDIPVPADYHGNGTASPAVFRSGSGLWAIRGLTRVYYGGTADRPLPADYNGNGSASPAIFRSGSGLWAVRSLTRVYFGGVVDQPQPFDATGTGSDRIGIFRPGSGLWAIRGYSRFYFGGSADIPVTSSGYWSPPSLPRFGVELLPYHSDQAHLDKLEDSGAEVTRYGYISWRALEPENTGPNNFNWEEYDTWLLNYAQRGLTPIVTISDIPSWAGQTVSGPFEERARDDFAEFVGAVVRRYSRPPYNIKFWELFNEPDGTKPLYGAAITTWGYYGKDYALMLKAAYPAIKAADPDSQLVFGGLAYGNFTDDPDANNGNFYRNFLNVVLWHGAGEYFDYMNFHYYYFARDVWGDITGKISHLKEMMAGHGVEKPMICTEVGIWGYDEPYYLTLQARYLPRVFVRGFSEGLETVLWFPLATEEGHTFEGGLIREEDLSEKPAFISYQVMAAELADHRYRRELETGSTLLEGYEFVSSATGKSKLIIWAQDGESDYYAVTAERIRVAGIGGNQAIIVDGSGGDYDGENNGRVLISVTASPVYVQEW